MPDKKLTIGLLAHVDAGKTTLSEAMLYVAGALRRLGRVDHRDSFLDNYDLERRRGITIFSKQARLNFGNTQITLLDTPGHVDFCAETERTLSVLDGAVLVISGTDGVQAHTETIWANLKRFDVPTFVFVTKNDLPVCDKNAVLSDLQRTFGDSIVDFSDMPSAFEQLALLSENAMEEYLETGEISTETIAAMTAKREVFPCLFGSGLKTDGVDELLDALCAYLPEKSYPTDFGARIYKISRDNQDNRLTFLKVTGGTLSVRDEITYLDSRGNSITEKVSAIRLYSGQKFDAVQSVSAGTVCAVSGLSKTYALQGLGTEPDSALALTEPVMSYGINLPKNITPRGALPKLLILSEEDPQLHIAWSEGAQEISVRLMGKVQAEIFVGLVKERFDMDITLSAGKVMYRETIKSTVEGVGHFEPLRHYSEVHLLMSPLPEGSGIIADTTCPEDELDRNWQRLILTHIYEKQHIGVLTGAPLTDVKITLAAGKAHLKHTEGGDFRQSTYRAIRQGLMQAESVLLEPYYSFRLTLPSEHIGRAMSDVKSAGGTVENQETTGDYTVIEGIAPVESFSDYTDELLSYTHGKGRLSLKTDTYRPARNPEKIISETGYDPEGDLDNTPDSVFCAHGAGFNVKWNQVPEYMHLDSVLKKKKPEETAPTAPAIRRNTSLDDKLLEEIMLREFGEIKRPRYTNMKKFTGRTDNIPAQTGIKDYIIVDGYNVIFSNEELKLTALENMDAAREKLINVLAGYSGYTGKELVLVFDGYRAPGNMGTAENLHGIHVAYTKQGETADSYIEQLANRVGKNYRVCVVTNDSLIRLSALGSGVLRTGSEDFMTEVEAVMEEIGQILQSTASSPSSSKN